MSTAIESLRVTAPAPTAARSIAAHPWFLGLILPVTVAAVWEVFARLGWIEARLLPPPSTVAASVSSSGIDCSAPVQIRNMYGKPSHRFTINTLAFASHGSVSQGIAAPPKMTWLMKPKSWLNRPSHTRPDRNAGNAYGRIMISR